MYMDLVVFWILYQTHISLAPLPPLVLYLVLVNTITSSPGHKLFSQWQMVRHV